ncbi:MAG TPA: RNA 2',3'-cyclic phosphodiesterase [Anaerolinea thermolimosa]|uniref:RNA 2',3'-cyclic phosphodiesterase n=1 Tax=Anaerolinea thermolimosa TaxID=229919 RepID=A0A3D1JEQ8_9CHLR|nr:RNA 2',3'-cyclic phosphodiesterase [Anaerolinea thermolimosa]GAP07367.1 2'-5' RNA ligase [Anaerolinea thermolimosa]HCE16924.1 RNA 2',3'-cyclic phosphodiesterase [Anaerolinea thermolimosa]
MDAIRAFIAIPLPVEIRNRLGTIIDQLQRKTPSVVRWVTPENMHLTLKFLGNISPGNLDHLKQVLASEAAHHTASTLCLEGLGAFPNRNRPRVIWVGVKAQPALFELQQSIDRETARLGYPSEERDFSPHLTLGRISPHAGPGEIRQIAEALATHQVGEVGTAPVAEIILFRSDLRPGGAMYIPLFKARLKT